MQKNNLLVSLTIIVILSAIGAIPALGQESALPATSTERAPIVRFDLENGFERHFFYTLYRIGGKVYSRNGVGITHFPISELKFPLDAFMIYADLGLTFIDRITIRYGVRKNLLNRVGKMEDRDWIPYPGLKTIYSESDARLNALFTDADLIIRLFTVSFFSLRLGAGFTHQYYYYRCSNVTQWSVYTTAYPYIGPPEFIRIPGKVLTYEINYYILTLQLTPTFTARIGRGSLEITPAIRFSPYLRGRDIDDHVLRAKLSKGDCKGTAFMPFLKIRYIFSTRIFITAHLDYIYLSAKGKQNQSYYLPVAEAGNIPGWSARLDQRLSSQQLSVGLGAGYSFEFRR